MRQAAVFVVLLFVLSGPMLAQSAHAEDPHRIITRSEWGADETFLVSSPLGVSSRETSSPGTNERTEDIPDRVQNCEETQLRHPEEFRVDRIEERDAGGTVLRWPRKYSKEVKLLVVHHTALPISNDARTSLERMRALYEFHANGRGWGDIGYHYVIDEQGQIYEGRSGGKGVVGGHAYCANVGTIGITLMGDFEVEKPTLEQIQGLQWLLDHLAHEYQIDLRKSVLFHGQILPPVVRHRDLVSTICPGFYMSETLSQVRRNIVAGNLSAGVRFPTLTKKTEKTTIKTGAKAQKEEDREGTSRRYSRAKRLVRTAQRQSPEGNERNKKNQTSQRSLLKRPSRTSFPSLSSSVLPPIRIRLSSREVNARSCEDADLPSLRNDYRGDIECVTVEGKPAIINTLPLEQYLMGLAEEPDTEPFEKQKAFAIAARSYAAFYMQLDKRKFPGMPYDGDDSPGRFQAYDGKRFEEKNPEWVRAVRETAGLVLMKDEEVIKAPYFSSSDGRTRSPAEIGWTSFPFAEIFSSKPDPWCAELSLRGHGVGMSGCGAHAQALEGKNAEEILNYYYPGTRIASLGNIQ